MNFDLSDDQVALRDGIRAMLGGRFGMARVREGFDRAAHGELAAAGVFSLREDGFGWPDAAIVYEELGRAAVPGPVIGSFGRGEITEVVDEPVTGAPLLVPHLDALDSLLVLGGDGIRRVEPADLVGRPVERPLDPLTPVWWVDALPAGEPAGDRAAADALRRAGTLLSAAMAVGLAGALLDLAVAYAGEREQFDRPIGSFQAVKHLCADMAVRAEIARAAVHAAACVLADPAVGDATRALSAGKVLAGEAAILNGRSATQVFGGMGFTWEVDVHLYLKRAWVLDTTFGSVDHHADAVAAALGA